MAGVSDQNLTLETHTEQQPGIPNGLIQRQIVAKEQKRMEERNFVYSFLPIYYVSRFFGLMPYTIIYDSRGGIQAQQVRAIDGLWFIVSICIYVLAALSNYQTMKLPDEMTGIPFALYFGHYTLLIEGLIVCAIAIGLDMYNRCKLVVILNAFSDFDKEVSGNHCKQGANLIMGLRFGGTNEKIS